jgi:superfamily II DNA or RNA helicase
MVETGDKVRHERFGLGNVEHDKGATVLVRFEHGIEECEKASLEVLVTPLQALKLKEWHAPLEVIVRTQAETIQSVNDAWGVFSPSRIALLPHQLWVCRRVLETWPTRWLVADDVGLGKTIEAGLILWPLLANGTIKRFLVVCSASLVEQWQYRLRTMFDIRLAQYVTGADTEKTDFWGTHNQVVASLETLRLVREERQDARQSRLLESPLWDLLIVDEAHHLNADEASGPTLGFRFVKSFLEEKRVESVIFFTGTPHRGKDFGLMSLLSLLKPELFDPKKSLLEQLPELRRVMIRNNKQSVTDLNGKLLFKPPVVNSEIFSYSAEEDSFYKMLTDFILSGKAYASSLSAREGRKVMLVLIAMQKLASSSVAAIRHSLRGRLNRIVADRKKIESLKTQFQEKSESLLAKYDEVEKSNDIDAMSQVEEQIAEMSAAVRLMKDEEQRLQELVDAAEKVKEETKIKKIISILENQFNDRPVLFFTEYKATQSLLMSAIIKRFGENVVTFINGDGKAEDVALPSGKTRTFYEKRDSASEDFNKGSKRFLISTEAGGEGIDLQESCHTLIHVDLPWNPMRLHQRVGRLNRYGQLEQVEVMTLRNPDTVESLIWDRLNEKIYRVMLAFGQVMEEPEDLLQMVLGMTSPSFFREIFAEAESVPREKLSQWFDQKTASFGGRDVIETVKNLVGNCSKFDFQQISNLIPKLDIPALKPFITSMLTLNNRRPREDSEGLSFKTPDAWLGDPGIRKSYEGMSFDRSKRSKDAAQKVLGVGHKVFNQALNQAKNLPACVASIPTVILPHPLFIFRVYDRVTGGTGPVKIAVIGIGIQLEGTYENIFMKDWELLDLLNTVSQRQGLRRLKVSPAVEEVDIIKSHIEQANAEVQKHIKELSLPFKLPTEELIAILWPIKESQSVADEESIDKIDEES